MNLLAVYAQEHLAKGGNIRRKCWGKELFITKCMPRSEASAFETEQGKLWVPGIRQLKALDWELA